MNWTGVGTLYSRIVNTPHCSSGTHFSFFEMSGCTLLTAHSNFCLETNELICPGLFDDVHKSAGRFVFGFLHCLSDTVVTLVEAVILETKGVKVPWKKATEKFGT